MRLILSVLFLPIIMSYSMDIGSNIDEMEFHVNENSRLDDGVAILLTRIKRGWYKGKLISSKCEREWNLAGGVGGGSAVGTAGGVAIGAAAG